MQSLPGSTTYKARLSVSPRQTPRRSLLTVCSTRVSSQMDDGKCSLSSSILVDGISVLCPPPVVSDSGSTNFKRVKSWSVPVLSPRLLNARVAAVVLFSVAVVGRQGLGLMVVIRALVIARVLRHHKALVFAWYLTSERENWWALVEIYLW
ncbi:hypothetical protein B0H16DRAFT_275002 [Mycena metata]|uniref:Uncharacterized protein n=1 Tax=Mycena metata TaxID=1033252 RepID=A0AAD7MEM9_9AGAR|nr:hypothetical protein B0H16DRAFT_1619534 [Mycena metata]KAJ7725904.1 hypothetical protein B0H16DRAFT_275002 [Mycena metata]